MQTSSNYFYDYILNGSCEMGRALLEAGAGIKRVESTVCHIMTTYGVFGEVSAIPTALIVSLTSPDGRSYSRMCRIVPATVNIEVIERLNALSRAIYEVPPEARQLPALIRQVMAHCRSYSLPALLVGYFLGAFFFTFFFQGGWAEACTAGVAGTAAGLCNILLERLQPGIFFKTAASATVLGIVAYGIYALGISINVEIALIGGLMVLVPGLIFTNFMSNFIEGDALAGFISVIQCVIRTLAMAVGISIACAFWQHLGLTTEGTGQEVLYGPVLQCAISFFACCGFSILYNIHGWGTFLCCIGGAVSWAVYLTGEHLLANPYLSCFLSIVIVAIYAQLMARIRKYPVTAYLIVSYFPLIPGADIYNTMRYILSGQLLPALHHGIHAAGIAACMALASLLVSSLIQMAKLCHRRMSAASPADAIPVKSEKTHM